MSQENDANEPMPEDEAEFREATKEFLDMVRTQYAKTGSSSGKTVRISLNIPVECMTVFAWIEYRCAMYDHDKWGPNDLSSLFPLTENQKRSAKFYIMNLITHEFELEYRSLLDDKHRLLKRRGPEPRSESGFDLDDDIQF